MRCDQFVGLNSWASRLVSKKQKVHEIGVRIMPNGKRKRFNRWFRIPLARRVQIGLVPGAFDEYAGSLSRYVFPDGRVYEEFVQATPWSSGPCYFIALKDREGNPIPESLWTDKEIDAA